MPTLRWLTQPLASALHVAEAILTGRSSADANGRALVAPARELGQAVRADGGAVGEFLGHLIPLLARGGGKLESARVAWTRLAGRARADHCAGQYPGLLAALESAFARDEPGGPERLTAAAERSKGTWARHGPALVAGVVRWTEEQVFVPEADVILVPPAGLGGAAHVAHNLIRLEAWPAAEPGPGASAPVEGPAVEGRQPGGPADGPPPDVLRLVWLLARLNLDLPRYADGLGHRTRAETVGALGLVPPVLEAAEGLRLARADRGTMALVLNDWLRRDAAGALADTLADWWSAYRDTRPAWPTALAALGRLVGQARA